VEVQKATSTEMPLIQRASQMLYIYMHVAGEIVMDQFS
jgi:hypothetical protein